MWRRRGSSSKKRFRKVSVARRAAIFRMAPESRKALLRIARNAIRVARGVRSMTVPSDHLIFVGRGMRPAFEAYAALYPASPRSRRKVHYFISPSQPDPTVEQNVGMMIQALRAQRVVGARPVRYVVVDYQYLGGTLATLTKAIQRMNPESRVVVWQDLLSNSSANVAESLLVSLDRHPRTFRKTDDGRVEGPLDDFSRRQYLYLSRAIHHFAKRVAD